MLRRSQCGALLCDLPQVIRPQPQHRPSRPPMPTPLPTRRHHHHHRHPLTILSAVGARSNRRLRTRLPKSPATRLLPFATETLRTATADPRHLLLPPTGRPGPPPLRSNHVPQNLAGVLASSRRGRGMVPPPNKLLQVKWHL
eukprot:Rmarinus@m.24479